MKEIFMQLTGQYFQILRQGSLIGFKQPYSFISVGRGRGRGGGGNM